MIDVDAIEKLAEKMIPRPVRSHWKPEFKPRPKRCVGKDQLRREKELRRAKRNAKDWRDWPAQAEKCELEYELDENEQLTA